MGALGGSVRGAHLVLHNQQLPRASGSRRVPNATFGAINRGYLGAANFKLGKA